MRNHPVANKGVTLTACFPLAAVYKKLPGKVSGIAVAVEEIAKRRAAGRDGIFEYLAHRQHQVPVTVQRYSASGPHRRSPRRV